MTILQSSSFCYYAITVPPVQARPSFLVHAQPLHPSSNLTQNFLSNLITISQTNHQHNILGGTNNSSCWLWVTD